MHLEQHDPRCHSHESSRQVDDCPLAKHESSSRDRSRCCGGHAIDECLQARIVRKPAEVRRWNHDQQIAREENAECGERGSEWSTYQVANERHGDHHRAWSDHRNSHGIQELPLRQPLEVANNPAIEKRHDCEAASKYECTCLGEVPEQSRQCCASGGAVESGDEPDGQDSGDTLATIRSFPQEEGNNSRKHEKPYDFRFGPSGNNSGHDKDCPEEPVLRKGTLDEFVCAAADDRDHRRANAVEHTLHPGKAAQPKVHGRKSQHHQKRRYDEGDAHEGSSENTAAHPPEVNRQLCRERTRGQLGKSEAFLILLRRDPSPVFDKVSPHIARQGDRPTESNRSQPEEVQCEFGQ